MLILEIACHLLWPAIDQQRAARLRLWRQLIARFGNFNLQRKQLNYAISLVYLPLDQLPGPYGPSLTAVCLWALSGLLILSNDAQEFHFHLFYVMPATPLTFFVPPAKQHRKGGGRRGTSIITSLSADTRNSRSTFSNWIQCTRIAMYLDWFPLRNPNKQTEANEDAFKIGTKDSNEKLSNELKYLPYFVKLF